MLFQAEISFLKNFINIIFIFNSQALPSRGGSQERPKLFLKEQGLQMSITSVPEAGRTERSSLASYLLCVTRHKNKLLACEG